MKCFSRVMVFLVCSGALSVHAQSAPSPEDDPATWEARKVRAESLREQAGAIRKVADERRTKEDSECRKAFFENACYDSARDRWLVEINKARALEVELAGLERSIRLYEVTERQRKQPALPPPAPATSVPGASGAPALEPASAPASAQSAASSYVAPKPGGKPRNRAAEVREAEDRAAAREHAVKEAAERAAKAREDAARYEARKRAHQAKQAASSASKPAAK